MPLRPVQPFRELCRFSHLEITYATGWSRASAASPIPDLLLGIVTNA
jgi:hypothetical protein